MASPAKVAIGWDLIAGASPSVRAHLLARARARVTYGAMTVSRCPAPRRDGRACGTLAASPGSRFCKRHEALADKWRRASDER